MIFGLKKDEVTGVWKKIHNEELHALYSSPNIIRVIKIKNKKMDRTCGTRGRQERCKQGFVGGCFWEKYQLEDLSVDGRIILKCIHTILMLFISVR
jgi:hypothetical protein